MNIDQLSNSIASKCSIPQTTAWKERILWNNFWKLPGKERANKQCVHWYITYVVKSGLTRVLQRSRYGVCIGEVTHFDTQPPVPLMLSRGHDKVLEIVQKRLLQLEWGADRRSVKKCCWYLMASHCKVKRLGWSKVTRRSWDECVMWY